MLYSDPNEMLESIDLFKIAFSMCNRSHLDVSSIQLAYHISFIHLHVSRISSFHFPRCGAISSSGCILIGNSCAFSAEDKRFSMPSLPDQSAIDGQQLRAFNPP